MEKTKKDRYRTAAPVETRPPIIEPEPKKPERFIIENKRIDGRTLDEFRPICEYIFDTNIVIVTYFLRSYENGSDKPSRRLLLSRD